MLDKSLVEKILIKAIGMNSPITLEEVVKGTSMKYIGVTEVDVYIYTNKKFVERIINNNLFKIKQAIIEFDEKSIKDVYLNGNMQNFNIKELNSKKTIATIDMSTIRKERTNEVSGENDIINETFHYESTVLNKKIVTLVFYNKELNKTKIMTINTRVLNNSIFTIARNKLRNNIKSLLELRFKPNNNDTKEVIDILNIN